MGSGQWGPSEPELWLTRPLGTWESVLYRENPPGSGPRRANLTEIFYLETKSDLDLDKFQRALRTTIYNQPNLRARIDLHNDPIRWVPAKDFDEVFQYRHSNAEKGREAAKSGGVHQIWDIVEEEGNKPWNYDSEKPLYRCILIRINDGYAVMHIYHHSLGDGSSGMYIMKDLLHNYEAILSGLEPVQTPLTPCGSSEEVTLITGDEEICKKMIAKKIEKANSKNCYVPLDQVENQANDERDLSIMKTLFHEGSERNLLRLRARCKKEKTTIGALATAAQSFAVSVLEAKKCEREGKLFAGIQNHYTDIPVNIRQRVDPPLGSLVGFYVTEIFVKTDVGLETNLWDLARQISADFRQQQEEKQHLLYHQVKKEWETGETAALAASADMPTWNPATMSVVSNIGVYPGPKQFSWGKLKSMHCTGFLAPFLLLTQSTDIMCYNLTSIPGKNNEEMAQKALDVIVDLMENAGDESRQDDLISVLSRFA